MKRKLIRQGGGGLTLYVPKKWVDAHGLQSGDEIEVTEEDNRLVIDISPRPKDVKRIELSLGTYHFNIYRSYIGGLYRQGYDEISVTFKNKKIISDLQKVADTLYGYEIFDIKETSCVIKSVFSPETPDIQSHFLKMGHIIRTMQSIIMEDIEKQLFDASAELFQFRNTTLKHRDCIARSILRLRLFDDDHFPYYLLAFNLWNIARYYYNIYKQLTLKKMITPEQKKFLGETNLFFSQFFGQLVKHSLIDMHTTYETLVQRGIGLMNTQKQASLVISYGMAILMAIQSSNSSVVLLNLGKHASP